MNPQFLANLLKAGQAGVQLARAKSGAPKRRRSKKGKAAEDCTPCAAQAYIESLRPTPPPQSQD